MLITIVHDQLLQEAYTVLHRPIPFHKVRASSWCSLGCPNLPDPPVDHFKALDTNATRSGEFWSIRLNNLTRHSDENKTHNIIKTGMVLNKHKFNTAQHTTIKIKITNIAKRFS